MHVFNLHNSPWTESTNFIPVLQCVISRSSWLQGDPTDYVEKVAENMQLYPTHDFLTGHKLLFQYHPQVSTPPMTSSLDTSCSSSSTPRWVPHPRLTHWTQAALPVPPPGWSLYCIHRAYPVCSFVIYMRTCLINNLFSSVNLYI